MGRKKGGRNKPGGRKVGRISNVDRDPSQTRINQFFARAPDQVGDGDVTDEEGNERDTDSEEEEESDHCMSDDQEAELVSVRIDH